MKYLFFTVLTVCCSIVAFSQKPWECSTYPWEEDFRKRMKPMLERIAGQGFGIRSKAVSTCPDTGLPVRVWAVEGETIISPYTGRSYIQGPTGYFGPKSRNEKGEITAFGGDPLKYDLPPATASLLLNPSDSVAKAFLSIPGNMRQQYHFACKNWARFYPLLSGAMSDTWRSEFYGWVGRYAEVRRPSDGTNREWLPLSNPHNLVGEPGHLLGGNPLDGGTENHKTMWRTSALLYAQLFPDTARISGYPVREAEKITKEMIRDFLKRLLYTGNGEYDSQVYYPHTMEGFLNLYDFSPDEETRMLAKFALDYFFVTYGLKVIDGTIAGAQKRGYLASSNTGEMEAMLWAFFNHTSRNMDRAVVSIQQATTTWRPNRIICDIVTKKLEKPFEAKISRPFYHMDYAHAFAETFYCSGSYAMGNIQMTIVDNPNQQMVWAVVAEGNDGPLCFSGGHPLRGSTSGHSPYTQTLHSKGTLILLTAPSSIDAKADTVVAPVYSTVPRDNLWLLPSSEQGSHFEIRNRAKYAAKPLHPVDPPKDDSAAEMERFWQRSKGSASSWFFFPNRLTPVVRNGNYFFEANEMFLAVLPLAGGSYTVMPSAEYHHAGNSEAQKFFRDYSLIVIPGQVSGYIVETAEKSRFGSLDLFIRSVTKQTRPVVKTQKNQPVVTYTSLGGERMEMHYQPGGLRCIARLNGKLQNWNDFSGGAAYDSPYLKIKDGMMEVTNGKEGYRIDFTGDYPIFEDKN